MRYDCIIFDFDGTLAATERAYWESFRYSIRLHTGVEANERALADCWYRNQTPEDILRPYGSAIKDMLVSFEEHYYANRHLHMAAYDGVTDVLETLERIGTRVAVVSLKPRRAGEKELDLLNLRRLVGARVWGDDVRRPKPEPDGVLRVLSELRVEARRTLVVGDSPADIRMGRAAGTRTAAALWGGARPEYLLAESPDLSLDRPVEVIEAITGTAPPIRDCVAAG